MASPDNQLADLQNQEGHLDPKPVLNPAYNPNKRNRQIRREAYARWYWLRDNPQRVEAEADWDAADKEYQMYVPPIDPDDWRSHLELPDSFAAIQSDMQETIERKARPTLVPTDNSEEAKADFANAVMNYNMNNTGFDYQWYLAKLASRIRGTAFLMNYWRTDKRIVKDPTGVTNGEVQYTAKEITDFDDDYTEWVPNEFIHIDEKAMHIDEAVDMFRREILNIEEFHRIYGNKPGFFDTEFVYAGGDRSTRSFFQTPSDITEQDVEVLHYYNRAIDAYWVVANNVTIHDSPLPSKHKELPIAVIYCYRIPGQFWGMGLPKVIMMLSEERKAIRRLNLDKQKLQIGGAFLHNSAFDLDDEDTSLEPGRFISIETNGQPINNAIQRLEFGDTPASYFRTEEILLDDITRVTGINPLAEAQATSGTATQAAILKENTMKRINYLSITAEMDTIVRIGKLKWSNIQFFYPLPRMEKIGDSEGDKQKKVYRTITVQNQKFEIVDDQGSKRLKVADVQGYSALQLKPDMARYMEGDFDITVDADIFTPVSKAIEQTKKTELFSVFTSNPAIMANLDLPGAMSDVLKVNNIKPETWLKQTLGKKDMMMLAESENMVMAAGQPLSGTVDATEDHTLVHLMFTRTPEFLASPHELQQIIMDHILQEHDANPATGQSADLMGAYGLGGPPEAPGPGAPGGPPPGPGGQPGPQGPSIQANTGQNQPQIADLQATTQGQ